MRLNVEPRLGARVEPSELWRSVAVIYREMLCVTFVESCLAFVLARRRRYQNLHLSNLTLHCRLQHPLWHDLEWASKNSELNMLT